MKLAKTWTLKVCSALTLVCACSSDDKPASSNGNATSSAGMGGAVQAGAASQTRSSPGAAGSRGPTSAGASASAASAGAAASPQPSAAAGTLASTAAGAVATNTAGAAAPAGTAGAPATGSGGTQTPAVACNPADKGPEPKAASFKQIMGYQSLAKAPTTGPSNAVLEEDPGLPKWTIYRPEMLSEEPHPVLAWGEGGCLQNGTLYGNWLLELASYGYIVLADGPPTEAGSDPIGAGMRTGPDGSVLVGAIEWLIKENDRPCSRYYHKIATTKLAVSGQSCGGLMALASAGDKRITTAVIGNSGLFAADQKTYSALHGPIAYLIGGSSDVAYQNAENDYMNINNVPIFNANMDTGHGGTWNSPNGGEFGRVGKAWLDWQLKGDMAASKLFLGPDCELCKSPSMWTVKKKMLD